MQKTLVIFGILGLVMSHLAHGQVKVGIDSNYALDMQAKGAAWSRDGKTDDVYRIFAQAGCTQARIRLWTNDDGTNGLNYALKTAQQARRAGLQPYVVIFLSENWADLVKQPAPSVWKDLPFDQKLKAVQEYSAKVTKAFVDADLGVEWFEIGNEIDFGLCGEFEEAWPKRVSLQYMSTQIWPKLAAIAQAAQAGVRSVQPKAKFILHLAQWANADYCIAFWKFMLENNVAVDFAGLTYFPTSAAEAQQRPLAFLNRQIDAIHSAIQRPVIICESGYPCSANFGGQFGDWNKPIEGYGLDETGQARWWADYLVSMRANQNVSAVFCWSPEWCGPGMWEAFALFDAQGRARPAIASFAETPAPPRSITPAIQPATQPASQPATRPAGGARSSYNVYFGNLHSHTGISDGVGTPAQAFAYARDVAGIDFLAITEHNHLMGGDRATPAQRDQLYKGPDDTALIPTANRFNQDGKFVAIYGQEFSSMSKGNHVNVFDVNDVIDVPNGQFDALLKWLEAHRDSRGNVAVMQMNHPGLGYQGQAIGRNEYGRDDFKDDAGWVAAMGPVTYLIEVLNGEPPKGVLGKRSMQFTEDKYKLYLLKGFRLGPTGDQDNHQANWGAATESRTGIIAPRLSRADLLDAMRARHVYASEDRNLRVIFRVNGRLCGDEITSVAPLESPIVEYEITDADEPNAQYTIQAFSGVVGEEQVSEVKSVTQNGDTDAMSGRIDGLSLKRSGQFIYFRVTQRSDAGIDRAWTAPIWLALTGGAH